MSLHIQGMGWASSFARNLAELVTLVREGMASPLEEKPFVAENPQHPRLRRAGRISQYAWRAVQDAIADTGKKWTQEEASRTGLIFLSTHGSICHTIRFFDTIAAEGTGAGSPIFFPETVYNAPPSHIASQLGIEGMVTSLVGDSSVLGEAFCLAEEWMSIGICEQCFVVTAEEIHPFLQKAYSHLLMNDSESRAHLFSDGAAAILLKKNSPGNMLHPYAGSMILRKTSHLNSTLCRLFKETAKGRIPQIILTSAMGPAFRVYEHAAISELWPRAVLMHPKNQLGESFATSHLGNVIIGESLLRSGETSPILISFLGMSGQASAALLSPA